jgi:hypothetical protein
VFVRKTMEEHTEIFKGNEFPLHGEFVDVLAVTVLYCYSGVQ